MDAEEAEGAGISQRSSLRPPLPLRSEAKTHYGAPLDDEDE